MMIKKSMKLRIVALLSEIYFSTCMLSIVCAEYLFFHKSFFFRNNKTQLL